MLVVQAKESTNRKEEAIMETGKYYEQVVFIKRGTSEIYKGEQYL